MINADEATEVQTADSGGGSITIFLNETGTVVQDIIILSCFGVALRQRLRFPTDMLDSFPLQKVFLANRCFVAAFLPSQTFVKIISRFSVYPCAFTKIDRKSLFLRS